ncbi:MAG: hypothetical protein WCS27_18300, partial [Victivallaceae bacterium]
MGKFGSLLACTKDWNILATVLVVMWISGICASIMNNVSYTAAIVSVVAAFLVTTPAFAAPAARELMWWGLALAVCLGGNGTLVGAAANLVTVGIAEKSGLQVSFKDFLRYGLPVTTLSMIAASIYIIIRYYVCCA